MFIQSIMAHSYQYTFEPNPTWSAFYAPTAEICKYLHRVAEKYGVMRYVQLSHEVISCTGDDSTKKWYENASKFKIGDRSLVIRKLKIKKVVWRWCRCSHRRTWSFERYSLAANTRSRVIWRRSHAFGGVEWEVSDLQFFECLPLTLGRYDFRNKKVGVIGGVSSSIQIVPSLQARRCQDDLLRPQ